MFMDGFGSVHMLSTSSGFSAMYSLNATTFAYFGTLPGTELRSIFSFLDDNSSNPLVLGPMNRSW
jgi:hypothetical protein